MNKQTQQPQTVETVGFEPHGGYTLYDPKDVETGQIPVSPWTEGVLLPDGELDALVGSQTTTRHPQNRRVLMDTSSLSYHNPTKLPTHHDLIVTTEAVAREHGAVGCTGCYGGGVQYEYPYAVDGGVLP